MSDRELMIKTIAIKVRNLLLVSEMETSKSNTIMNSNYEDNFASNLGHKKHIKVKFETLNLQSSTHSSHSQAVQPDPRV